MYQAQYNAFKNILDMKGGANGRAELDLFAGMSRSEILVTLSADASIEVRFTHTNQLRYIAGTVRLQANGNAAMVGNPVFLPLAPSPETEKMETIIRHAKNGLLNHMDRINVPVPLQDPGTGISLVPSQHLVPSQRTNVILYKAQGGELAAKFVKPDGTPDTIACDNFIKEMGPDYAAFARTYPQQPSIIFNEAYRARNGELAVKFSHQGVRDAFFERLKLNANQAVKFHEQPATLYFSPSASNPRPNLFTAYTPAPSRGVGRR